MLGKRYFNEPEVTRAKESRNATPYVWPAAPWVFSGEVQFVPCLSVSPHRHPALAVLCRTAPLQLPLYNAAGRGPPSTHLPHAPDLQLRLHTRLLGLHGLVGDDGAHGAA